VKRLEHHIGSVHTEESEKKFPCTTCGKGFPNSFHLKKHEAIHQNEKPYRCREGCDVGYNDSSNRNQHERKLHGARGGWSKGPRQRIVSTV
jgi:uncharacterized Zn-finger protein